MTPEINTPSANTEPLPTESHPHLSIAEQIGNLLAVTLPIAGLALAGVFLWGYGFSWVHLGLLLGMYVLTGLGITIGYHRLFTHKAFEARLPLKPPLAVLGSMAVEGPLLKWAAVQTWHCGARGAGRGGLDPHSRPPVPRRARFGLGAERWQLLG